MEKPIAEGVQLVLSKITTVELALDRVRSVIKEVFAFLAIYGLTQ
jgi:hypothetical protein